MLPGSVSYNIGSYFTYGVIVWVGIKQLGGDTEERRSLYPKVGKRVRRPRLSSLGRINFPDTASPSIVARCQDLLILHNTLRTKERSRLGQGERCFAPDPPD